MAEEIGGTENRVVGSDEKSGIERGRCKAEKADLAIHRRVLFAVEVCFGAVGGAVCLGLVVVVVKKMVRFLQYHYLEHQRRQQGGYYRAI